MKYIVLTMFLSNIAFADAEKEAFDSCIKSFKIPSPEEKIKPTKVQIDNLKICLKEKGFDLKPPRRRCED